MVARNEADGEVLSVNVGAVREFEYNGRIVQSGIWKFPVSGRVMVKGVNLDGDDQADRSVHGGPDKAVYVYAVEDQRWWQGEIDRALQYGEVGENLTTRGIDVSGALVGERWRIGSCLFEVSEPRFPCWKLGARMGDPRFPKRFAMKDDDAYLVTADAGVLWFDTASQWRQLRTNALARLGSVSAPP